MSEKLKVRETKAKNELLLWFFNDCTAKFFMVALVSNIQAVPHSHKFFCELKFIFLSVTCKQTQDFLYLCP